MRALKWLRSPRLVTWLFIGLTAYTILATLWPHGGPTKTEVLEWDAEHPRAARVLVATGMHRPYSRPWFLVAAAVLTASTAVCAYDRTRRSSREYSASRAISRKSLTRTQAAPDFTIPMAPDEDVAGALQRVEEGMRGLGWSVQRGPNAAVAAQHRLGYAGSPLFHWSLAALFVFAGVGQLTRSEGVIGLVPGGQQRLESGADDYLEFDAGPLFGGRHTGYGLRVESVEMSYTADGVNRGDVPLVALSRGETTLAKSLVHPNHPLRFGSLIVHRDEPGPALVAKLRSGEESISQEFLFRASETATLGILPLEGDVHLGGADYVFRLEPRKGQRIALTLYNADRTIAASEVVVGVGETASLPGGVQLEPTAFTYYIALRVQNDWTVPWIYLSFALATVGICLAVFYSPRRMLVVADPSDPGRLCATVYARRMDPATRGRVKRHLLGEDDAGADRTPAGAGGAIEQAGSDAEGTEGT